jgi:hypothetical protein
MKKPIDYNAHLIQLDKIVNSIQTIGREYLSSSKDFRVFRELCKGMRYLVGTIAIIEELNAQSVKKPSK